MNKATFTSRAKKAGINLSTRAFREVLADIEQGIYKFYPVKALRRSYSDKIYEFHYLLEAVGLEYTEGNDAPRGGRTGIFYELTPASIRKVKPITKAYVQQQEAKFAKEKERKEQQKAQAQEELNERIALANEPLSEKEKLEAINFIKNNPKRSALANAPKSVDKLKYASGLSWGQLFYSLTGTNGK